MIGRNIAYGGLMLCALTAPVNGQTVVREPAPPAATAAPHPWTAPASGPEFITQPLSTSDIHGVPGKEMRVFRSVYPPGAVNSKHFHASHAVFYILEGSGVWQEEGKQPVTVKAGDVVMTKPGTVHAHWNPSTTQNLVFFSISIVDQGMQSTVKTP
jgi:quercetin dioxygenase-like cupin family protein